MVVWADCEGVGVGVRVGWDGLDRDQRHADMWDCIGYGLVRVEGKASVNASINASINQPVRQSIRCG